MSQLRALQWRGLKYIEAPRPELYDTNADPHEIKNLFGGRQADAHLMRDRLFTVLRRYTPASGASANEKALTDPALLERLQSLGYVAISSGTFADASGKDLPDPKDRVQVYELFWEAMADGTHGRYEESLRNCARRKNWTRNPCAVSSMTNSRRTFTFWPSNRRSMAQSSALMR